MFFYSLPPSAKQVVGLEVNVLWNGNARAYVSIVLVQLCDKSLYAIIDDLVMLELMCQQCWRGYSKAYEQELIV
jgi:hypothetical protein